MDNITFYPIFNIVHLRNCKYFQGLFNDFLMIEFDFQGPTTGPKCYLIWKLCRSRHYLMTKNHENKNKKRSQAWDFVGTLKFLTQSIHIIKLKLNIFSDCKLSVLTVESFWWVAAGLFLICPRFFCTADIRQPICGDAFEAALKAGIQNPETGVQRPETIRENYNNLLTHCTLCYNPHTQVFNWENVNKMDLTLLLSVDIMTWEW